MKRIDQEDVAMKRINVEGLWDLKELKSVLPIKRIADFCTEMGNQVLADICNELYDMATVNIELLEDTESEMIYMDDPANTAAMFRALFKEREENPIEKVGEALITKGSTIGRFKVLADSYIPEPRPSLARNIKELYEKWKKNGTINEKGFLTRDVELNSRNQSVCLALGCSANANVYLSDRISWN